MTVFLACPCRSGRQYQSCCKRTDDMILSNLLAAVDAAADLYLQIYKATVGPRLGATFTDRQARQVLKEVMIGLETNAHQIAARHTALFWLNIIRHRHVLQIFKNDNFIFERNAIRTAETVAVKYGRLGADDLNIAPPTRRGRADGVRVPHVSIPLTKGDVFSVVALCILSIAIHNAHNGYSFINDGGTLVLGERDLRVDFTPEQQVFQELALKRLQKWVRSGAQLSTVGLIKQEGIDLNKPTLSVPFAPKAFEVKEETKNERSVIEFYGEAFPSLQINYWIGWTDLVELSNVTEFAKERFEEVHGLPWDVFCCFLGGLGLYTATYGLHPKNAFSWMKTGRLVLPTDELISVVFGELTQQARGRWYPELTADRGTWESWQANLLNRVQAVPADLKVFSMQPVTFVIRTGTWSVINLPFISRVISDMIIEVPTDSTARNERAKKVEEAAATFLETGSGLQRFYPNNKRFMVKGLSKVEADVSFRIGPVYIPVDVKSYTVSNELQRGDYGAFSTRQQKIQDWIRWMNSAGTELSNHPVGDNYDLLSAGITHVLPVVVSTFPESIHRLERRWFLEDDIPRIALPQELAYFLKKATSQQLIEHPGVTRISNS